MEIKRSEDGLRLQETGKCGKMKFIAGGPVGEERKDFLVDKRT